MNTYKKTTHKIYLKRNEDPKKNQIEIKKILKITHLAACQSVSLTNFAAAAKGQTFKRHKYLRCMLHTPKLN